MAQYQNRSISKTSGTIMSHNRSGKIIAINPITHTLTGGTLEFRNGSIGSALAGTFTAVAGVITAVVITNGGTNYSPSNPPVIDGDVGGSNAVLTPTIVDGVITAITIENGGTGYTSGSLVITAGVGSLIYEVGVSPEPHKDLNLRFSKGLYLVDNGIAGDYLANVLID